MFLSQLNSNDSTFWDKMTQFFLSEHREKKLSHFDLKSWVTGGIRILPNFVRQNDSIFHSVHREKKLSHFDPKSWVTGLTKIWSNFWVKMTQFFALRSEKNNWAILTLRLESQAELQFNPNF